MIVLDTNVVSEAMRTAPDAAVMGWLNDQVAETLYLSSVTTPDGYIAAIAAARGFAVASRDTSAYQAAGVQVINPWAKV